MWSNTVGLIIDIIRYRPLILAQRAINFNNAKIHPNDRATATLTRREHLVIMVGMGFLIFLILVRIYFELTDLAP